MADNVSLGEIGDFLAQHINERLAVPFDELTAVRNELIAWAQECNALEKAYYLPGGEFEKQPYTTATDRLMRRAVMYHMQDCQHDARQFIGEDDVALLKRMADATDGWPQPCSGDVKDLRSLADRLAAAVKALNGDAA